MKKVSTVLGIIIIVVAAIILFSTVFVWQFYAVKNFSGKVVQPQTANSAVPATAGWETYKNDEYGLEISYPNDWDEMQKLSLQKDGLDGAVMSKRGEGDYFGIAVYIMKNDSVFYKNFVSDNSANDKELKVIRVNEEIKVNNINATRTRILNYNQTWRNTILTFSKGDIVYVIIPNNPPENLINEIFSTVKFTKEN